MANFSRSLTQVGAPFEGAVALWRKSLLSPRDLRLSLEAIILTERVGLALSPCREGCHRCIRKIFNLIRNEIILYTFYLLQIAFLLYVFVEI